MTFTLRPATTTSRSLRHIISSRVSLFALAGLVWLASCHVPGLSGQLAAQAKGKGKGQAQTDRPRPDRELTFKQLGDVQLKLHVFQPAGHSAQDRRAAIVFFFGGGWNGGSPSQFYPHCRHVAEHGMLGIAAEYRVKSRHQTPPSACVRDGNSAIRYVRAHAAELGVDPQRIAAGGGSAGGHVAAATATTNGFDEPGEDLSISSRPNALVLFNPVYDNGPEGYGHDRVKDYWQAISPLHNIRASIPPSIVFLGTKDSLIPVATAREFQRRVETVGGRSQLHLYEGQAHGFFNFGRDGNRHYLDTVAKMDSFLKMLGYYESEK